MLHIHTVVLQCITKCYYCFCIFKPQGEKKWCNCFDIFCLQMLIKSSLISTDACELALLSAENIAGNFSKENKFS